MFNTQIKVSATTKVCFGHEMRYEMAIDDKHDFFFFWENDEHDWVKSLWGLRETVRTRQPL